MLSAVLLILLNGLIEDEMTITAVTVFERFLEALGTGLVVNALGVDVIKRKSFTYRLEDSLDWVYGIGFMIWLMLLVLSGGNNIAKLWFYGFQTAWLGVIIGLKVSAYSLRVYYSLLVVGLLGFIVLSHLML
ncbi:MAG: hypothetical protein M0Z31_04595 [Clostridia bacterium]|nr:hypothetical protein [Clostridia bacterium]